MKYAIQILENEINMIQRCLTEWESKEHQEAKKEREKRLKELNEALNKLTNK
jgi:hypothetical protein